MFFRRNYFILFLTAVAVFGSLITWYTYRNAKRDAEASLIARTATVAQLVEEPIISSFTFSEADLSNPQYQILKKEFISARAANPDVRFIYILGVQDGSVFFVVDSEPEESEGYSAPGQVYPEVQPEVLRVFESGVSEVQSPYHDSYGSWVTGLSPVTDAQGVTRYLVGIDIDSQKFMMRPLIEASFPAMLSMVLFIIACALYVLRKREMELVKTKSQFMSVASHELRAPLTGIRWSTENLLKQKHSEQTQQILEAIHDSSLRLLSVINDLLSISNTDHAFIDKKTFVELNLKSIVRSVIAELAPIAESSKIVIFEDMCNEEVRVMGNADRLRSLFLNLMSNALKYSRAGGRVQVSIGVYRHFQKRLVRVTFKDEGIGIPQSDLKKIMQGFYRAGNAQQHTSVGTGLGLYTCQKIAQAHGGDLDIESLEGKGTMVIVSLPFYGK